VENRPLKGGLRLIVADNLESVEDLQDVISNSFLVTAALAVILGVGAGIFLSRSILHRVENVTQTAEGIIGGDLSQRIALSGSGDDFDRLSATLNTMLDRITGLLESLRQVSSDIAHDLRTPLSHLRQRLESVRTREASLSRTVGISYRQIFQKRSKSQATANFCFSSLSILLKTHCDTRRRDAISKCACMTVRLKYWRKCQMMAPASHRKSVIAYFSGFIGWNTAGRLRAMDWA
jgi:signal transduction histidine kinase